MVEGWTLFDAFSVEIPSRSLIVRSYCTLVSRRTCEVTAMPDVVQKLTPPPAAPVTTTPEPPVPVATALPVPPVPVTTCEPPLPGVGGDPPDPVVWTLPMVPVQPAPSAAAAKKAILQLFLFMALTSTGWVFRRATAGTTGTTGS